MGQHLSPDGVLTSLRSWATEASSPGKSEEISSQRKAVSYHDVISLGFDLTRKMGAAKSYENPARHAWSDVWLMMSDALDETGDDFPKIASGLLRNINQGRVFYGVEVAQLWRKILDRPTGLSDKKYDEAWGGLTDQAIQSSLYAAAGQLPRTSQMPTAIDVWMDAHQLAKVKCQDKITTHLIWRLISQVSKLELKAAEALRWEDDRIISVWKSAVSGREDVLQSVGNFNPKSIFGHWLKERGKTPTRAAVMDSLGVFLLSTKSRWPASKNQQTSLIRGIRGCHNLKPEVFLPLLVSCGFDPLARANQSEFLGYGGMLPVLWWEELGSSVRPAVDFQVAGIKTWVKNAPLASASQVQQKTKDWLDIGAAMASCGAWSSSPALEVLYAFGQEWDALSGAAHGPRLFELLVPFWEQNNMLKGVWGQTKPSLSWVKDKSWELSIDRLIAKDPNCQLRQLVWPTLAYDNYKICGCSSGDKKKWQKWALYNDGRYELIHQRALVESLGNGSILAWENLLQKTIWAEEHRKYLNEKMTNALAQSSVDLIAYGGAIELKRVAGIMKDNDWGGVIEDAPVVPKMVGIENTNNKCRVDCVKTAIIILAELGSTLDLEGSQATLGKGLEEIPAMLDRLAMVRAGVVSKHSCKIGPAKKM